MKPYFIRYTHDEYGDGNPEERTHALDMVFKQEDPTAEQMVESIKEVLCYTLGLTSIRVTIVSINRL